VKNQTTDIIKYPYYPVCYKAVCEKHIIDMKTLKKVDVVVVTIGNGTYDCDESGKVIDISGDVKTA
jgi:hypothetical protein